MECGMASCLLSESCGMWCCIESGNRCKFSNSVYDDRGASVDNFWGILKTIGNK